MRFLSVCSGIEAASVAWGPLGWHAAAFSEIEPFPCSLLAHHYPSVPNLGDMTRFQEWPDLGAIDLLCGGTPCQSFSVAGLRAGLADPRGNLMLTFGAIAARYRPEWLVWENVPGVLSSNGGRDFGAFLGLLGELGYGFAYRILDAQYAGVPQRRRRVFVVGCAGSWQRAAAVLFERHGLQGHPAPRREAGQGFTGTLDARANRSVGVQDAAAGFLIPRISPALKARDYKGPSSDGDGDGAPLIVTHALTGEGFDASEDGTGRGTPLVPVLAATIQRHHGNPQLDQTLVPVLAFDTTQVTSKANRSNPEPGDPCHPLAAGAHAPSIAFDCKATQAAEGELSPTLRAMNGVKANAGGQVAVAFDARQSGVIQYGEKTGPLDTDGHTMGIRQGMQVRRLTPRECERLQGFEDDYTLIPHRSKPAADGPRYKALGNSWAVPCVRWIGERIDAVAALNLSRLSRVEEAA